MKEHRTVIIFFSVTLVVMIVVLVLVYKYAAFNTTHQSTLSSSNMRMQMYPSPYMYPDAYYNNQPTLHLHPVTITSISSTTGDGSPNTPLALYGNGFEQGDQVYFFIASPSGQDFMRTVVPTTISSDHVTFNAPQLGSGAYTVGIAQGYERGVGVSYSVNPAHPSPAHISGDQVTSVSWNDQQGPTMYFNPRFYAKGWEGELVPVNDDASAVEWCRLVPHAHYSGGTSHTNGVGTPENYKYQWNGSSWTRLIDGEYARYYQCYE